MPNPTTKKPQDDDLNQPQAQPQPQAAGKAKEQEPVPAKLTAEAEEAKLMAEIRTTAETADKQALEAIQSSVQEAKRAHFEPELPPDVEDAGVVNPTKHAEEVVSGGTTIEVGTSENVYQKGLAAQVKGKTDEWKNVSGVASLAVFAIWIGRLLKMAHKHTLRIVFRKEGLGN